MLLLLLNHFRPTKTGISWDPSWYSQDLKITGIWAAVHTAASAGRLWKSQQNPAAMEESPPRSRQATACLSDGSGPGPSWTWAPPLQTAEMGGQPNGVLLRGISLGVQPPGSLETGCAGVQCRGPGEGAQTGFSGSPPQSSGGVFDWHTQATGTSVSECVMLPQSMEE